MEHQSWMRAGMVLALAASVIAAPTRAQQGAGAAPLARQATELPQVVVTGARFEEPFDAGRAIGTTVITADEIRQSGATSIYDALRRLGGLFTRSSGFGTTDDSIDLRGFGVTGDQNTLVLVDGQRVSENELQPARLSAVPLNSIERIEIVRGSGAVMYGGGATGGVINVVTRDPQAGRRDANLHVAGGSFATRDLRVGAGIGTSSVALDINANRFASANYRRNNGVEQENVVVRLRMTGDSGSIGLRVASERQHSRLPGALNQAQYTADPRQASAGLSATDTDANLYALSGSLRWRQVEFAAELYRRDKVNRFFFDTMPFGSNFSLNGSSVDGVSPRVRVAAPLFGLENALVAGFDSSRWAFSSRVASSFASVVGEADLATGALASDETGRQTNRAWYFRNETALPGAVRLSIGARRETVFQSLANPLGPAQAEQRRDLHAEEVALAWKFAERWTLHGRAGNSFRIGNIDENRCRFANAAFFCAGLTPPSLLAPQTSRDAEAGMTWASRDLEGDLRLFRSRLVNEIMLASVPGPFGFATQQEQNLPPTLREGLEVRAKWRPHAALSVGAFYTRVKARFVSGVVLGRDLGGKEIPVVPVQRMNLAVDWRVSERDSVSAGWQYVGSQIFDNDQTNECGRRIPAYATLDAKYTRKLGDLSLSISATNLANKGYYAYGLCNSSNGNVSVYPERPRAIFVAVEGRFR